MIVVLKQNSDKGHVEKLMQHFTDMGLRINYSEGADTTILGLMGDTTRLDERDIMAYDVVERVQRVTEPFKAVNRKFHPEDTIIEVAGRKIGHRLLQCYGRSVLGRERSTDRRVCRARQGCRCILPARRRIQAPYLPVLVPGSGGRGSQAAARGKASDRSADRHRDHERKSTSTYSRMWISSSLVPAICRTSCC